MSNARTATVHLGANRVVTSLAECISTQLEEILSSASTKVFSREEYVKNLRATVVTAGNRGLLQNDVEPILKDKKALDRFDHIVITEHALLGSMGDMLTKKKMFPKAKQRVQNVDSAFSDRKLNLHLAIAPQSEGLISLLADGEFSPDSVEGATPVHSWADLVRRVRDACPRAVLRVWDFEKPDEIMPSFLSSLLAIEPDLLDHRTRDEIVKKSCQHLKNAKLLGKIVQIDKDLQTRMDAQYELDLAAIAAMPNIELIQGLGLLPNTE